MENICITNLAAFRPKVAFICNHNSCRSQIAEALGKLYGSDVFDSYSAGTIIKSCINPDAVRLMKSMYGIDMQLSQFNKTIDDIPRPDIAVYMGCNVSCPMLSSTISYNWGLDDPSGGSDEQFMTIINLIDAKVKQLVVQLQRNEISWQKSQR